MKELEQHHKVEIHQEANKQHEKQQKFLGSIKPKKGHTLFKIDVNSWNIDKAKFETDTIVWDGVGDAKNQLKKRKLIVEDGYFYISALNKDNAMKKYFQLTK